MKVSSTLRKWNHCPLCLVIYTELYQASESGVYIYIYHSASDVSNGLHHFTTVKSLTQKSPYLYAN